LNYFELAGKYPILSPEEQLSLVKESKEGNKASRDKLILSNIRFVIMICKKYKYSIEKLGLDVLISEGLMGLDHAIDKYKFGLGTNFITYADRWVKSYINKLIYKESNFIHIPTNLKYKLIRYKIFSESGYSEIDSEIYANVKNAKTIISRTHIDQLDTFDNKVLDIPDKNNMEEEIMTDMISSKIVSVLNTICTSEIEQFILKHRYGIGGSDIFSLRKIGQTFGVSSEMIRQHQIKIERKLKTDTRLKNLFIGIKN
jgi:RNA polymerase primary sigma factor